MIKLIENLTKRKTIKNGFIFSFFSILNNGIGFFLLIYIAKYISPDGYGQVNLFNTFIMLFNVLISLNSRGLISVEFFSFTKRENIRNINSVFFISTSFYIFLLIIECLFSNIIEQYTGLSFKLQIMALSICLFQVFYNMTLDIWRLEEKPIKYGIYTTIYAILNFSFSLILIIELSLDWMGKIYTQLFVAILFFISSIYVLLKKGYLANILPNKQSIKAALYFGVPLIPHVCSIWLRQGLDRYFINFYHSSALVGLFSFSLNFANIIQIIGVAFNATNSVYIYKILSNPPINAKELLRKQTLSIIVLYIALTTILIFATKYFIPILFPHYTDSVNYVLPLCIGALFQCFYLLFVDYIFFYKKNTKLMYITFFVSILHAILSFVFTRYSVYYTIYIGMLSNILIFFLVFRYSQKLYKII